LPSHLLCKNIRSKIKKTTMLPVIFHGCESWSPTLREEYRLRVFENRVQRGTFGPKSKEVVGGWRRLHNEELHNLYAPPKYY
jgi:hypothetical protein